MWVGAHVCGASCVRVGACVRRVHLLHLSACFMTGATFRSTTQKLPRSDHLTRMLPSSGGSGLVTLTLAVCAVGVVCAVPVSRPAREPYGQRKPAGPGEMGPPSTDSCLSGANNSEVLLKNALVCPPLLHTHTHTRTRAHTHTHTCTYALPNLLSPPSLPLSVSLSVCACGSLSLSLSSLSLSRSLFSPIHHRNNHPHMDAPTDLTSDPPPPPLPPGLTVVFQPHRQRVRLPTKGLQSLL
jgi:hypothetical protein